MEYLIKIENFEGPFDLLLHLIKQEELNIWEIEISTITDQYLTYLDKMKYQNLKIASEYLYMAAYLVEIKSRMLIPKEVVEIESEYQENPHELLVKQLLEYKRFKDLSALLNDKNAIRRQFIDTSDSIKEHYIQTHTQLKRNKDIEDLAQTLKKLYTQLALEAPVITSMQNSEISIEQAISNVILLMQSNQDNIICVSTLFAKMPLNDFVVTFLAILDLAKNQQLTIEQMSSDDVLLTYIGGEH